jgi:4-amino-4-deoxy-L-arabinose transferase-like glycosyltransferase
MSVDNRIEDEPWPPLLWALLAAAFVVRIAVRVAFGQQYFWTSSYFLFYGLAERLASGHGFCRAAMCVRPPLYPLFLTPSVLAGKSFLLVVVPEALLGCGTAWCAFLIGREMFNRRVGLLACAITAFYPYYVMHDTALQDTAMVTFVVALAVWLLLRAARFDRWFDWFVAGIALGAIPLVRASIAPAVAMGVIWCVVWGASGAWPARLGKGLIVLGAVVLTVGPWLSYTYRVTGAPVITSDGGVNLWVGNNAYTFSHYPGVSIDRSRDEALRMMSPADRAELQKLGSGTRAQDDWFAHRAVSFIRANPELFARGAVRKVEAAFSWRLNPWREPLAQAVYAAGYVPVALLGTAGMILAARRRATVLIAMLFIAFIAVTAAFWAHTSHRTYLDVYLIVFAASVVERLWARSRATAAADRVAPA